jgi:hypothetical protein
MNFENLSKVYNRILEEQGLNPDKYEREDAFMGIYFDHKKGIDLVASIIDTFDIVHGVELEETYVKSVLEVS